MRIIEITGGATAAAVALGVYLRWAVGPLAVAYRVGRDVGRRDRHRDGQPG
jgi:hypothetical protein